MSFVATGMFLPFLSYSMVSVDSGAVAQDGRIEPGDMILEVNGFSFENMSNDDAVKTLREAVQKPGWVFWGSTMTNNALASEGGRSKTWVSRVVQDLDFFPK